MTFDLQICIYKRKCWPLLTLISLNNFYFKIINSSVKQYSSLKFSSFEVASADPSEFLEAVGYFVPALRHIPTCLHHLLLLFVVHLAPGRRVNHSGACSDVPSSVDEICLAPGRSTTASSSCDNILDADNFRAKHLAQLRLVKAH